MQSHVAIATGHAAAEKKRLEFYAVPFSVSLSLSLLQEAASGAAG